jgi:hypothetical protein
MKKESLCLSMILGLMAMSGTRAWSDVPAPPGNALVDTNPPIERPRVVAMPPPPVDPVKIMAAQTAANLMGPVNMGLVGNALATTVLVTPNGTCLDQTGSIQTANDGNGYSCILGRWRIIRDNINRRNFFYNAATGAVAGVVGFDGSTFALIAGEWRITLNRASNERFEYRSNGTVLRITNLTTGEIVEFP